MNRANRAFALVVLLSETLVFLGCGQGAAGALARKSSRFQAWGTSTGSGSGRPQAIWQTSKKFGGLNPDISKKICKPGADVSAVVYRSWEVWMLTQVEEQRLAPWMKDGQIDD